jgi:long-subunit fatty acid transport protein
MIPVQLRTNGIPNDKYSADIYLEGSSIIYDGQLGVTYAINDMFSVYAGGRINFANNSYVGHIRDISINPRHPALNPTGEMMLATTFFNNAKTAAQGVAGSLQPIIDQQAGELPLSQVMTPEQIAQLAGGLGRSPEEVGAWNALQVQGAYNQAADTYAESARQTANKELDCTQTGMGVTPVLGFNFNWKNLNVGIKYEFITKMDVKNKSTTINTTGIENYDPEVKTPNDIPAWLSIGAQYQVIPSVKVSAGFHHFFDCDAKMAKVKDPATGNLVEKQKFIDGGINEFLLGAEWQINKMFLISAGGQMTKTGVKDEYQSDMSYSLNSYSVGMGGAINVTEKIRINLAYFFTKYEDWTKKSDNYNNISTPENKLPLPFPGQDTFSRTNNVIGIGIDYRL